MPHICTCVYRNCFFLLMLLLWFSLHVYEEDEEAIENVSDETLWTVTDGFEMPSTGCELSVNPLNKNDLPQIVFHDASVRPVKRTSPRYSSTSTSNLYSALKMKQALFQKDDGVPVHIKGGPVDKFLFGITLALCAVGTIASFHTLYVMAYPKRA